VPREEIRAKGEASKFEDRGGTGVEIVGEERRMWVGKGWAGKGANEGGGSKRHLRGKTYSLKITWRTMYSHLVDKSKHLYPR
jgi:hypothetical protein